MRLRMWSDSTRRWQNPMTPNERLEHLRHYSEAADSLEWLLRHEIHPSRNREIRRLAAAGWTHTAIAEETGVTVQRIGQIVKGTP